MTAVPTTPRGSSDQNPTDVGLFALVVEDLRTHGGPTPGFWAVAVHRFGNWRMGVRRPLRAPLTALYRAAFHGVRLGFGIDLPYDMKLGRRVRIEHHGAVVAGANAIGDDVVIRHSAVLGIKRRDAVDDKPTIGRGVEIGPRACIAGAVTVGEGALICANSVVPIDVPPGATVLGVPGRLVDLADHTDQPASRRPLHDVGAQKAASSTTSPATPT
jgi:serine O-acetyltransferase